MKKALSRIENARLVCSGEDFFETLIEMISHAKNNIQMQFYIFRPDSKGEIILKLLQAKASEGVKIDLLVDAIGSQYDLKKYEVNGFDIMEFSPMSSDLFKQDKLNWLGRRLHYKAMVVDGRECLVGGINIGEEYIGSNKQKPWLDLALYFRGEISSFLSKILSRNWLQYGPALRKLKHIRTYEWNEKNIGATIRVNDYRRGFREITNSYQWAISQAREEVIIMSAYFFPGRKWKEILKKAIAKGVKVKIILGSHSDLPMYNRATHYLYRSMLSIGCEIYEWEESIVHGKVCCIDRKWI
jgi:cardiolipin synthase